MEEKGIQVRIKEEIDKLMVLSEGFIKSEVDVHTIEKGLFRQLLRIRLALLSYMIEKKIKGFTGVGAAKGLRSKGTEGRQYLSLFGMLTLKRPSSGIKSLGRSTLCMIS